MISHGLLRFQIDLFSVEESTDESRRIPFLIGVENAELEGGPGFGIPRIDFAIFKIRRTVPVYVLPFHVGSGLHGGADNCCAVRGFKEVSVWPPIQSSDIGNIADAVLEVRILLLG